METPAGAYRLIDDETRVKALAEKLSKLKQVSHRDYEPVAENLSFPILDRLGKNKGAAILVLGGKVSGAYQSKAAKDAVTRTDTEEMDHSAHLMENDKQGISATRTVGTEPSLGSSNADFRGWGRGFPCMPLHQDVLSTP